MRIEQLHIENFGRFECCDIRLAPGLNLLFGPNEAGKSTLLAFVRGILFGFERRGQPTRYEPPLGPPAGELLLQTRAGPVWVRRLGNSRRAEGDLSLRAMSGERLPAWRLTEGLSGISRDLFCQVFAFGLEELSSFRELAAQGSVSEALFVAGMEGARRLPHAASALRKSSEAAFSRKGARPELNRLLAEMVQVKESLAALGDRPAQYFAERQRLRDVEAHLAQADAAAQELATQRRQLDRLRAALADLTELSKVEAQWGETAHLEGFPEGAALRWEGIRSRMAVVRAEIDQLSDERESLDRGLKSLPDVPAEEELKALRAALAQFSGRREQYRSLPGRDAALADRRGSLDHDLKCLGTALTAEDLRQRDFGSLGRGRLEAVREESAQARQMLARCEERHREAMSERIKLERNMAKLRAEMEGLPSIETGQLRRRHHALTRIPPLRERLIRLKESEQHGRRALEQMAADAPPALGKLLPLPLAAAAMSLALGVVTWSLWQLGSPAAGVAAFLGAAMIALMVAVWHRARKLLGEGQAARKVDRGRLIREVAASAGLVREALAALRAAEAEAGVAPGTEDGAILELLEAGALALERALERDRIAQELKQGSGALSSALDQERVARIDAEAAQAQLGDLRKKFEELLAELGLPSHLSADGASALWLELGNLRQRLMDLQAEERMLAADQDACSRAANSLILVASGTGPAANTPEAAADELGGRLDEAQATQQRYRQLSERLQLVLARQARLEKTLRELAVDADRLFEEAGCSDEQEFQLRMTQAVHHRRAAERGRELTSRVQAVTGLALDEVRARLCSEGGTAGLAAKLKVLEERLAEVLRNAKAWTEQRGEIRTLLRAWETDEEGAVLRAREEVIRSRILLLAEQYSVDRLALALLGYAQRRHEQEQQPRVVKRASAIFRELTADRYLRAYTSPQSDGILFVRDSNGQEWTAEQLSRGTREQLYLAFRLAVVEDFAQSRQPMPLLVDDILVNFDPPRAANAMTVLARMAQVHQVVAFTCHPSTRNLFERNGAAVQEIGLQERQRARESA